MNRDELQKKGHHEVYGDIAYPRGVWFDFSELENFDFTGFAIVCFAQNQVFDIYHTEGEARRKMEEIDNSETPYDKNSLEVAGVFGHAIYRLN